MKRSYHDGYLMGWRQQLVKILYLKSSVSNKQLPVFKLKVRQGLDQSRVRIIIFPFQNPATAVKWSRLPRYHVTDPVLVETYNVRGEIPLHLNMPLLVACTQSRYKEHSEIIQILMARDKKQGCAVTHTFGFDVWYFYGLANNDLI